MVRNPDFVEMPRILPLQVGSLQQLCDYGSSSGQASSADVSLSQSGVFGSLLEKLDVKFSNLNCCLKS